MRITLSARSKILQLSHQGSPFRIQVHGNPIAGSHVDLIPLAEQTELDDTICHVPHVIADLATVNFFTGMVIDYDYGAQEFIISNRGKQ